MCGESERGAGLDLEATSFEEMVREGAGCVVETGLPSLTGLFRDTNTYWRWG